MIQAFLLRWLVNFLGLWAAATLLSGIDYHDSIWVLVFAALIFSVVNACIRPLIVVLSLPAIVLTLGLFMFVINALMLYLVAVFYPAFQVASFGQALLAAVIVWLVNYLLASPLKDQEQIA